MQTTPIQRGTHLVLNYLCALRLGFKQLKCADPCCPVAFVPSVIEGDYAWVYPITRARFLSALRQLACCKEARRLICFVGFARE